MGCKQYNRILGLSRGYPYILYLDLNKWDAPLPEFFHNGSVLRDSEKQPEKNPDDSTGSRPTPDWPYSDFSEPLTPASRPGPRPAASAPKLRNRAWLTGAASQRRNPWQ